MMDFLDHMTFICFAAVLVGIVLGGICWIGEKLIDKFWSRDKFVEFLFGPIGEDED